MDGKILESIRASIIENMFGDEDEMNERDVSCTNNLMNDIYDKVMASNLKRRKAQLEQRIESDRAECRDIWESLKALGEI